MKLKNLYYVNVFEDLKDTNHLSLYHGTENQCQERKGDSLLNADPFFRNDTA